jgi:hypothetical protein
MIPTLITLSCVPSEGDWLGVSGNRSPDSCISLLGMDSHIWYRKRYFFQIVRDNSEESRKLGHEYLKGIN